MHAIWSTANACANNVHISKAWGSKVRAAPHPYQPTCVSIPAPSPAPAPCLYPCPCSWRLSCRAPCPSSSWFLVLPAQETTRGWNDEYSGDFLNVRIPLRCSGSSPLCPIRPCVPHPSAPPALIPILNACQVFRLELSSSESDSDDGGRHKKDRKKDKCVESPFFFLITLKPRVE